VFGTKILWKYIEAARTAGSVNAIAVILFALIHELRFYIRCRVKVGLATAATTTTATGGMLADLPSIALTDYYL
jgi:hypothetical protein